MTEPTLGPLLKLTEAEVQEFIDYAREPETSIAVMGYCVGMNSELHAQRQTVGELRDKVAARDQTLAALRQDVELRADEHRTYMLAAGDEYTKVLRERDALQATVARAQALREEIYIERIEIMGHAKRSNRQADYQRADELSDRAQLLSQIVQRLDAALKGDGQ